MKIVPIYKNKVLALPAEVVSEKLSTATKEELQVLLSVYAEPEFDACTLASKLEMTVNVFNRALESWRDNGVLSIEGEDAPTKEKTAARDAQKLRKSAIASTIARYTSNELAAVVETREGCTELLDSCQQILGKIFNTAETSIIIGLLEQMSLSHEYILRLCMHAAEMQKKSVRYVEKMAIDLYDRDITTYPALEEELLKVRDRVSFENFVRELFGTGKRALIKKEKDFIVAWSEKFKFSREMIQKAYEITVSKTNDSSMSYANAILENWYAAGFKSVEEVETAEQERTKNAVPTGSSFSTDSFFEAALKRSYEGLE